MADFAAELLTKAKDFKARLTPKENKVAKEVTVDPVQALDNFITRLEQSGDSRIQRHGELIRDQIG